MPESEQQPHPTPPQPHPKRASTFTTSRHSPDLAPSSASALRSRGPRRKSSAQSLNSSHSRSPDPRSSQPLDRRASTFSLSSIEELSQSLTEDLINPSFTRQRQEIVDDEEVTNWHSTPLLFALLPAVGGVLFKEGAAVVTDLLILGLAAIFLNWSVRLPWDWYYAAQVLVRESSGREEGLSDYEDEDAIVEEDEGRGEQEDGDAAKENVPQKHGHSNRMAAVTERREEALAGLRTQEILALLSTFLFPALAAYLLHVLRGQLSKPSTGLISDYNLSIFLLVAEIRPCRQLIRLIKRRTLHLQRTISGSEEPFSNSFASSKGATGDLSARIEELEVRLQKQAEGEMNGHAAKNPQQALNELSTEMKKRYESRIDALERAVRRYEKRTTTLARVTDQRLKNIDTRLSDTLSLAAVAAQQSSQRSAAGRIFDTLLALAMLPVQVVMFAVLWPVKVLEGVYTRVRALLFGKSKARAKRREVSFSDEKARERSAAFRKADLQR